MTTTVLHKAASRGHAKHDWLDAHHTFSFASYHNPQRMNFGVLRVLNDDIIDGGKGFGTHPHDNMEIITIPLEGELEHKDSMGNTGVIRPNEIQVMSAGTGVYHSEYNKNKEKKINLLQIWIFPNKQNVAPRYGQATFNPSERINKLQLLISPNADEQSLWVHQDVWFYLGKLQKDFTVDYNLKKKENGIYIFVISGSVFVNEELLDQRDGIGIWDIQKITLKAETNCEVLLMDVPMLN